MFDRHRKCQKNIVSHAFMKKSGLIFVLCTVLFSAHMVCFGQSNFGESTDEAKTKKAKAVMTKAIGKLGGTKYLDVKTSIGEGRFSLLKDGVTISFQKFIDVMVLPNKERTDFDERGSKIVQVNTGDTGWIYEEHLESFRDQKEKSIESFKKSLRSHYDYLLRRDWSDEATLTYVGRRRASLGKRNDVLKLTFKDGFEVEYEFSDAGLPMKTLFNSFNSEKKPIVEETRYARFISESGILTPFVVDRFTDGKHSFRVNYESVIYNKNISDEIFIKPADPKKLRKKLKL